MVFAMAILAMACGGPTSPSDPSQLKGGVLATFAVGNEQFKVWVTNGSAIARLEALSRGAGGGSIPNARVRRGPGRGAHNAPYSWHMDPTDIEIVDATIELCDGNPKYVDENVSEYVDRIGRYCPWGAKLVTLVDYR